MSQALPNLDLEGLSEAELFQNYLQSKYHLEAELLETKSTNCGNNITYLLELLEKKGIDWQSILLMQDASMMRRISATLKKFAPEKMIIDYATYKAPVTATRDKLGFEAELPYMWIMKHYISLLLGEIPRLHDDENGYGPLGKNFIAQVEIPTEVMAAFDYLQEKYPELVRSANPKFVSK
nr:YdcF family protein [Lactobacillus intestinalis]